MPPARKLVFSLQLTVAQCSILRYRGMKWKIELRVRLLPYSRAQSSSSYPSFSSYSVSTLLTKPCTFEHATTTLVYAPKSHKIEYVPMHTIRDITRLATMFAGLIAPRLRLGFASATSRLCFTYDSTTPWLWSPASIVARHAITLIVRLGT